jgi:hypothetical protein
MAPFHEAWKIVKGVDRLYVWSALAGLLGAFALIAIVQFWAHRA